MNLMDVAGDAIELDERSRDIFRQIVEAYLSTGEPIGSRSISRTLPNKLSPASIRNVMSDLEHLGLIFAPHTSAGRLPTDRGLRFFVDALLSVGELSDEERSGIEAVATGTDAVDSALTRASQVLSGMSSGAGVVLTATHDMRLKHIEFVALDPGKALVVLVSDDGSVENRIMDLPAGLPPSALQEASNYLNAHIRGATVSEAREIIARPRRRGARAARHSDHQADRPGHRLVVGRDGEGYRIAHRSRPRQPAPEPRRARGHRPRAPAARRSGDQTRADAASVVDRRRRGRADLHRLREQAVFALRLIPHHVALPGSRTTGPSESLESFGRTRLNYAKIIPAVDYTAQVVSRLIK